MSNQILVIYKFNSLYHIFEELDLDLNFRIIYIENENLLNEKLKSFNSHLVITNNENLKITNQLFLNSLPINIFKLVEKINIKFLKLRFNNQSHVKIKNYIIDLNSRLMSLNDKKLKLTEKEINTIMYLSKASKPVSIDDLEKKVWSYQSDIETHTVETHVYRLRKKISSSFNDNQFIISKKYGYQIK